MTRELIQLKIPDKYPGFIEVNPDEFVDAESATAGQWREQKSIIKKAIADGTNDRPQAACRAVNQMVKLAMTFGIPDDVELLPRLRALANPNVTAVRSHDWPDEPRH